MQAHHAISEKLGGDGGEMSVAQYNDLLWKMAPFAWDGITEKLNFQDKHPPLYFWLAHLWCLVFGFGIGSLLAMQVLLDTVLLALLAFSTRRQGVFWGFGMAAIVLCHSSFSESVVLVRHYHLLAIIALAFWQLVLSGPSPVRNLSLVAVTALGLYTHYFFTLLALGAMGALAATHTPLWQHWRTGGLVAAGALVAVVAYPPAFEALFQERHFSHPSGGMALKFALSGPLRLLLPTTVLELAKPWMLAPAWPLCLAATAWAWYKASPGVRAALLYGLLVYAQWCILLMLGKLPLHTFIGNRYMVGVAVVFLPAVVDLAYGYAKSMNRPWAVPCLWVAMVVVSFYQHRPLPAIDIGGKVYMAQPIWPMAALLAERMAPADTLVALPMDHLRYWQYGQPLVLPKTALRQLPKKAKKRVNKDFLMKQWVRVH
jgi:hypothetical protein